MKSLLQSARWKSHSGCRTLTGTRSVPSPLPPPPRAFSPKWARTRKDAAGGRKNAATGARDPLARSQGRKAAPSDRSLFLFASTTPPPPASARVDRSIRSLIAVISHARARARATIVRATAELFLMTLSGSFLRPKLSISVRLSLSPLFPLIPPSEVFERANGDSAVASTLRADTPRYNCT